MCQGSEAGGDGGHQFSRIACSWIDGSSEYLAEHVDYLAATITVIYSRALSNKYYKNVSPNLPFIYHTSRCDPELKYHTTTKTQEELLLARHHSIGTHNGAFLLVDAINPDGSIVPEVYHDIMKGIYSKTSQYEKYITGKLDHDAAIWFATHAKYDLNETKIEMSGKELEPKYFLRDR